LESFRRERVASCPPQATSRVKHGNRPVIWQVYKYLVRSGIELKTFRMGF
jgi:hypothetical protein